MLDKTFFKRIYLEITTICNLNCPFCPQTTRPRAFLSPENFQVLLSKLQGHTRHLYFHVLGEPLLHPHLPVFVQQAGEHGFQVNLVTNGSLIAKVGPQLLTKPNLRQISFSLHSLAHQEQDLAWQRLREILNFVDQAAQTNLYCSLRLWTGEASQHQHILQELASHFLITNLSEQLLTSQSRGIRLRERVFLNPATEFTWPSLKAPLQTGPAYCHALKQQLAILVDGTVVPCCLDGEGVIKLGNIYHQDLSTIYNSERTQRIVRGFQKRQAAEELCQRCGYRTRFT